jgi:hypothetical protein
MAFGVLGGGFGLYGYVPAALQSGLEVHTLARYRETIFSRPELRGYSADIKWHESEDSLFANVQYLAYVRTPKLQFSFLINEDLSRFNLLLEKPLAPNIQEHERVLELLKKSHARFSISYIFLYTDWYREILASLQSASPSCVSINWVMEFPVAEWKTTVREGGGLVDYYGIHFAPIFEALGIAPSKLKFRQSESQLSMEGITAAGSHIKVVISHGKPSIFQVTAGKLSPVSIFYGASPFGPIPKFGIADPRIDSLKSYLSDCQRHDYQGNFWRREQYVIDFRKWSRL